MKDLKEFFTTAELAEVLGVSRITIFNKIKKGEIKAQKMGRNFVIFKKDLGDIEILISELYREAKKWMTSEIELSENLYCENSGIFQARISKMEALLAQDKKLKDLAPILTSIAGEIGNNSFDHNLGQWPDIPGIFFGYDLNKRRVVLADRGLGVLKTLKRVKPELFNHKQAVETAFTEIISGRKPEARGNGLKYVKNMIFKYSLRLMFQTGDAVLTLINGAMNIENAPDNVRGCIVLINFK